MPLNLVAAASALASDGVCAEVVDAWRAQRLEAILLKGPTIADWLYPGEVRGYADVDLLVDPDRVLEAAAGLERLGFVPVHRHVSEHAHPWIRSSDGAQVDLHVTLWGAHRPAGWVWRELQGWVALRRLGPVEVRVLTLPARALHVVMHAAQHRELGQPREDLRRVLRVADEECWRDAMALAERIGGLLAMGEGLRLEPGGVRLAARLPLVHAAELAAHHDAPVAIGLARIAQARGPRAKARALAKGLFPPPAELRSKDASIDSGRSELALAYGRHAINVLAGAPRSLRALRRVSSDSISSTALRLN